MESEHPVLERRSSWHYFILAVPMSLAAPLVADCLQSFLVLKRGYRLYQAQFAWYQHLGDDICLPFAYWASSVGVRAIITLLVFTFLVKCGFSAKYRFCDMVVWLCFIAFWILFTPDAAVRK
jgi:hypothetical protein